MTTVMYKDHPLLQKFHRGKPSAKKGTSFCSLLSILWSCLFLTFIFYLTFFYFNRYSTFRTEEIVFDDKISHRREVPLPFPPLPSNAKCDFINDNDKFDCYPQKGANQKSCEDRGCCWSQPKAEVHLNSMSIPYCYYPKDYAIYNFVNLTVTDFGATGFMKAEYSSPYPKDVKLLQIDVKYETSTRLHVKVGYIITIMHA